MNDRYLIISDTQIPFHVRGLVPFLRRVQKEFRIPQKNILHVGDECDFYHLSRYPKNPDMRLSAITEYEEMLDTLSEMYCAFPYMRLCYSNHGARLANKAVEAQIPELFLKDYRELLQAPSTWRWQESWKIETRNPFLIEHGLRFSGQGCARTAVTINPFSTAFGHLHSLAQIVYMDTMHGFKWGFNTGSLINREALAFRYGKDHKLHANIGCGVVVDDGLCPIWVRFSE